MEMFGLSCIVHQFAFVITLAFLYKNKEGKCIL